MNDGQQIRKRVPITSQWSSHWLWIPTLYLTRGLPYVILLMTSLVYYNRMGLSNGAITLTTSWFFLPFILRPLLGRIVVGYESKRFWIVLTECVMALSLVASALSVRLDNWFSYSVAAFMVIAIAAALHDVAIERLYNREALLLKRPAFFGLRAVSYLLSIIVGMAIPITLAGNLEVINRTVRPAWATLFWALAVLMIALTLLHALILPKAVIRAKLPIWSGVTRQWWHDVTAAFIRRPHYVANLVFLFCFLIPEGMFIRVAPLFLIDPGSNGGLALSPQELGWVQGTVGTFAFIAGCGLGISLVRRDGLQRWLWPFVMALTLPKFLFVYLSYYFVSTLSIINICIIIDYFGAGLGLTTYIVWLGFCTKGKHSTFTYSLGTAITAFSMVMSGWFTGFLQEYVGYRKFFLMVAISGIISFIVAYFIPITKNIGKRERLI